MTVPTSFVDTNILVYARDPRDPVKQSRAVECLKTLWSQESGRISVQVLSEYYWTVTHKLAPQISSEDAWKDIKAFSTWQPCQIDFLLIECARSIEQRWQLNWWDSMVVAAAQLQECAILLTEDLQDGAVFGGVTVRNPFTHNVNEPAAIYAVHPVVASRHRGRGRPRKLLAA